MNIVKSDVLHIGTGQCIPAAITNSRRILIRESLETLFSTCGASYLPNRGSIRRDGRFVELLYLLDDSVYLCDVQLEVFEADRVQLICWQDRIAFVVKGRYVQGASVLSSADLRKFVSVKLFDIFRVGPCREGQHARGEIQTYT